MSMASCVGIEFRSAEYLSSMSCRTGSRFGVASHVPLEKVAPTTRTICGLQSCGLRCLGRILSRTNVPSLSVLSECVPSCVSMFREAGRVGGVISGICVMKELMSNCLGGWAPTSCERMCVCVCVCVCVLWVNGANELG